jgi:hypothetical protein
VPWVEGWRVPYSQAGVTLRLVTLPPIKYSVDSYTVIRWAKGDRLEILFSVVLSTDSAGSSGKCVGAVLMINSSDEAAVLPRRANCSDRLKTVVIGTTGCGDICAQTFERVPRPRRVLSEMDAYHEKANRYSIHRSLLAA